MKPGCVDCRRGNCYHIDINNLQSSIEILESAVQMLEERLSLVMEVQRIEPYTIELSDEDADKVKKFATAMDRYFLPERFRDIAQGE